MSEVRKNRSKWATEAKVGQEECFSVDDGEGEKKEKEMDPGLADVYRPTGCARIPRGQRLRCQYFPSLRLHHRMRLQEKYHGHR